MNIAEYYKFQAKARGMQTIVDVHLQVSENDILYKNVLYRWLPKDRNVLICEVACGAGILMHWLAKEGFTNVEGSDLSSEQIQLANAGGLNAKLIDAIQDIKSRDKDTLNCIIAMDFYEHLTKEEFLDFLFESQRALKKGGRLILRGPNGGSPFVGRALFNDITHQFALTPVAFKALGKMTGFEEIEVMDPTLSSIDKYRFIFLPVSWFARKILKIIIRAAVRENAEILSPSMFVCLTK